jgi:hypothetical protein
VLRKSKKILEKVLHKCEKPYEITILAAMLVMVLTNNAYAETPKLVTGTIELFKAISGWLLLIIPAGAGAILGYHALQKTMTEDDAVIADKNKKMKNVLISAAVAETASGLVTVVLSFYS